MNSISKLKAAAAAISAVMVAGVAAGALYLGLQYLNGNFHEVIAGELYRSGQLTPEWIDHYVDKTGIKTIVNLRGKNVGAQWYDAEVSEASKKGVAHIDFAMSAKRELSEAQAVELIAILKSAQKPILIHCEGGADRTGLASAIYLAAIKKSGEVAAEGQMSVSFGHFSLPILQSYAMNQTFEKLEPSFGYQD